MTRMIAVNDKGYAIGEDHHAAKLSNREVALLRELRADDPKYWTFPRLAEKFDISHYHARRLFHYQKRAQAPYDFRRASVGGPPVSKAADVLIAADTGAVGERGGAWHNGSNKE